MDDNIYWCQNCNVPLLSKKCYSCGQESSEYCSKDLKPVFPGERILFEQIIGEKLPKYLFRSRNRIIYNGKSIFRYGRLNGKLIHLESKETIKKRLKSVTDYNSGFDYRKIKRSNRPKLKYLENEAIDFIKDIANTNEDKLKYVSFSGGKDSTVTAMLVKNAGIGKIPLFFSDTTLEFDETYEYINQFKDKYGFELFSDHSDQDFYELCKELGPPSQTFRWCCTVFKTYPVNKFYNSLGIDREIVTFDGIRAAESARRKKYTQITRINKIPRQIATYPILYWKELEVWLYLLINKIDYNPLYNYGYTRVGCSVCPAASPFNCIIRKSIHKDNWKKFEKILYDYADKVGRDHKWVDDDYWRLRRPKKELNSAVRVVTTHKTCSKNPSFSYDFNDPINSKILEHLKPFGNIQFIDNDTPIFKGGSSNPFTFTGILNGHKLNVHFSGERFLSSKKQFEKQLTKALNCVDCGACIAACPKGAIEIIDNRFRIDDEKCSHCLECVHSNFISNSCIALSFTVTKRVLSG